jgi:hypothetical protein
MLQPLALVARSTGSDLRALTVHRYQLNRVSLPAYTDSHSYAKGLTDFPIDTLEKVAATNLNRCRSLERKFKF